ncbi:hypothetical protein [Massilia sp. TWP1-3-3]|uniref:hypothetical protein n=1 Tax=Massilia sp. TWP1-3-3 TaxID=2804573 RepID=UPI003CFA1B5D
MNRINFNQRVGHFVTVSSTLIVLLIAPSVSLGEVLKPKRMTQKQFDSSHIGMIYTCMALAKSLGKMGDGTTLVATIHSFRAKFPQVERDHDDFMKYAARYSVDIEGSGRSAQFWKVECAPPVARIKALTK